MPLGTVRCWGSVLHCLSNLFSSRFICHQSKHMMELIIFHLFIKKKYQFIRILYLSIFFSKLPRDRLLWWLWYLPRKEVIMVSNHILARKWVVLVILDVQILESSCCKSSPYETCVDECSGHSGSTNSRFQLLQIKSIWDLCWWMF